MNTGKIIMDLRKEKGLSQTDLAQKSGVSREMIGRYERGEAVPSIEAAKKIADAFEVSLDYLVGEGISASFDKRTVQRLQELQIMNKEAKEHILSVLDAFIRDFKTQQAYRQ